MICEKIYCSFTAKIDLAIGRPKRQKRTSTTKGFSNLLCVVGKLNVKLYEQINNYHTDVCFQFHPIKGFSNLLCVVGKLNVKLYEQINNYHTDVCFQFHPINSMSSNVSHNKTINYPVH